MGPYRMPRRRSRVPWPAVAATLALAFALVVGLTIQLVGSTAPTNAPSGTQFALSSIDARSPVSTDASPQIGTATATAHQSAGPSGGPAAKPTDTPASATPSSSPSIAPSSPPVATAGAPTLAQMVGQKLVVAMDGTTPSADLLGRIERGEVGGVILMGRSITTRSALVALTAQLHGAAVAGGRPALLIGVDQEGGSVKRISWIPPTLSPPQMGALASASTALAQGSATGAGLRDLGIDVDFAPVADVPASGASFMLKEGRTFSNFVTRTTGLANAFATGLESAGVVPAMKHFPGLGFASRNTDLSVVTITASRAALAASLLPYRTAIAKSIPLIMLSNATYTAYDPANAASWSRAVGFTLLRQQLGFKGVTITDSVDGTAGSRSVSTSSLAIRAAIAGTDLILTTGSEATSRAEYTALMQAATSGTIPVARLRASYARILHLKASR